MKNIYSAGIVVYQKTPEGPHYLLLLYPGGYWEFAKGKLETGETNYTAALRELREETGLDATILPGFQETIVYYFRDRQGESVTKQVCFFTGEATTTTVVLSDEHRDFVWLPFDKATQKIQHSNARELLKKAHTHIIKTDK